MGKTWRKNDDDLGYKTLKKSEIKKIRKRADARKQKQARQDNAFIIDERESYE